MYGQPIEISSQKNANELKEGILTLEIDSLFDVGAKLDDAVAKKISIEGKIFTVAFLKDNFFAAIKMYFFGLFILITNLIC